MAPPTDDGMLAWCRSVGAVVTWGMPPREPSCTIELRLPGSGRTIRVSAPTLRGAYEALRAEWEKVNP